MIEKDDKVAVAYYQTIPHVVKVNGTNYAFVVKANICMTWVDKANVDAILRVTKECCGGHRNIVYRYANENDVRRWTNGGGS